METYTSPISKSSQYLLSDEHRFDADGNPAGGRTEGLGIAIDWQDGPLAVDGVRRDPNGAFVEGVIESAIGRLEFYQSTKFACEENEETLGHLRNALDACHRRTAAREARGVEGTNVV